MTVLRWILVGAGCVLIAAIYIVGRMRRTSIDGSLSERVGASRFAEERPRSSHDRGNEQVDDPSRQLSEDVPQLNQAVRTRARPEIMSSRADNVRMDDMPPMRVGAPADIDNQTTFSNPVAGDTEASVVRHEPRLGELDQLSTGAFIASQAQPVDYKTQSVIENKPMAAAPAIDAQVPAAPDRTAPDSTQRPVRKPARRKIVALRLSAGAQLIEGSRLKNQLAQAGLRHGKYSIFHRLHDEDATLFSVASMVEPGTFDPHTMDGNQFPGITLFAQFPGPIDSDTMFNEMLSCARRLEQSMGGMLQDERGLPLTEQRAQRLREDIADFIHLLGQSTHDLDTH
jgi:cell division protein ZipA